jgi:hypothetical protein
MSDEGQQPQGDAPDVSEQPPQEDAEVVSPNEVHGGDVDGLDLEYVKANVALADSMSRKIAVLESGVDFDTPAGKLLLKALDASASWAEAPWTAGEVRSTAEVYGVPMKQESR